MNESPSEILAAREADQLDVHPDAATEELAKCKASSHVRAWLDPGADSGGTVVPRYLPEMRCRNDRTYTGDGVVLQPGSRNAGMQIFLDTARNLAASLPTVATEARRENVRVAIQHMVNHTFETWRRLTPDEADQLARELRAVLP